MTRFLIIDDEAIIRRGIRNKILRLITDAEIIGEAKDGEEALAMTEQLRPDIVITDIKMPKVDGLLYIENSLKVSSDTYFIVVSGYQDFAYVQKALKLGVCDYLLKPIEDEDLKKAVDQLIEKISFNKKQLLYLESLKEKISYNEILYRNNLLTKLVNGSLKDIELLDHYSAFISARQYLICSIRLERTSLNSNSISENELVRLTANMFEETVCEVVPCISFEEEGVEQSFVSVLYGSQLSENAVPGIKKAIESINNKLNIGVYVGLGSVYTDFEKIKESYAESQMAVMQKILFESKKIITFEDYSKVKNNEYVLLENKKKLLESYLKEGDYKNVTHTIDSIFSDIASSRIVYFKVASVTLELMFVIINTLKISRNYDHTDLNSRRMDYFFRECITLEDFRLIVSSRARQVCEYLSHSATETGKGIIEEILNRVEVEYYRNIKLIDLANEYYINPSYLSQLFLQQTQKNFKQYVSEIRIKYAKNLLSSEGGGSGLNYSLISFTILIGGEFMARKPRIEYPGALYHVMCRGNNREFVLTEEEKPEYLRLIGKYKERYKFDIYAYCIMDNHAHLLIETGETPLSKIMQGIQQSFTQHYNKKYDRTGHIFEQRYKAQLCDKEKYLWQLIKYIHYNPVEAGLHQGLDYKWSSHKNYIAGKNDSLLDVDYIFKMLSDTPAEAKKRYAEFMNIKPDNAPTEEWQVVQEIGSIQEKKIDRSRKVRIEVIIDEVCKTAEVSLEEIVRRTKMQKYSDIRKAIVILSERYADVSNKELSKRLNIPPSMVSKIRSGECHGSYIVDDLISIIENKGIIQA
jgi:putative transposase